MVLIAISLFYFTALAETAYTQPIIFSHKIHAGTNEIPCEFCHVYARRSINSGAPSLESCISCHKVIKGSDDKQKSEIRKLDDYWKTGTPIPWKKIHDLPDFVHYSHKRHLKMGYDCAQCHGDIKLVEEITMDTMIADLSMGWCLSCHNSEKPIVKIDIQNLARNMAENPSLPENAMLSSEEKIWVSKDCYTCHK